VRLAASWLPSDLLRGLHRERLIKIAERARHPDESARVKRYIACGFAGLNDEETADELGVSVATLPTLRSEAQGQCKARKTLALKAAFMPGLSFRAAARPRAIRVWCRRRAQQKVLPRARATCGGRRRPGARRVSRAARAGPSDPDQSEPGEGAGRPYCCVAESNARLRGWRETV
jgi:hypothetical protein